MATATVKKKVGSVIEGSVTLELTMEEAIALQTIFQSIGGSTEPSITLELTMEEAIALQTIFQSIGGSTETSVRKYTEAVVVALYAADIRPVPSYALKTNPTDGINYLAGSAEAIKRKAGGF